MQKNEFRIDNEVTYLKLRPAEAMRFCSVTITGSLVTKIRYNEKAAKAL